MLILSLTDFLDKILDYFSLLFDFFKTLFDFLPTLFSFLPNPFRNITLVFLPLIVTIFLVKFFGGGKI